MSELTTWATAPVQGRSNVFHAARDSGAPLVVRITVSMFTEFG